MTIKELDGDLSECDGELSVAGESDGEPESTVDIFDSCQTPVAEQTLDNSLKKPKPKKKKKKYGIQSLSC